MSNRIEPPRRFETEPPQLWGPVNRPLPAGPLGTAWSKDRDLRQKRLCEPFNSVACGFPLGSLLGSPGVRRPQGREPKDDGKG